jgi:glyoxylase-like metal-dependent hydrolase (beta-lactamase superfamily II)
MNLEDHLGDILAKARAIRGVSAASVAAAAGVSTVELAALEASGIPPRTLNYPAFAKALGVDAGKLEAIARGWLPQPVDLGRWRQLQPLATTQDGLAVNCYLVWDAATRTAGLFDTGWDAAPALAVLAAHQLRLTHLFITHGHDDHVAGLPAIRRACPAAQVVGATAAGQAFALGSLRVTGRPTPGHAADGVTWVVSGWPDGAPQVAVVGDALFAGSIGRGFQSWPRSQRSVREQIFTLPADTLVCPGHGPLTTVAEERAYNPLVP